MNKITKSFLMLLLTLVGVVSAQAQGWYSADKFTAKDFEGFTEVVSDQQWSPGSWLPAPQYYNDKTTVKMVKSQPEIAAARYVEEGDYIEVKSNNMPVSDYDCQFWMQIPEELRANGTKVEVSMQAWVDDENGGDMSVAAAIHAKPGEWKNNVQPSAKFVAGKWTDIKYVFKIDRDGVENYCYNLCDQTTEKARIYRFKNIQFAAAKPDWYYATEFHAKDYHNAEATYANDPTTQKLFPEPPFEYTEDGGYVEVVSNKKAGNNTWGSQIFIKIPDEYVGKSTKLTMKVKASEAVEGAASSFHFTASGAGWGDNAAASAKPAVPFTTDWKDITCILNTKGVTCAGELNKDLFPERQQANYFVLDLSQSTENAITYQFKDVKFDKAQEEWYTAGEIIAKDYANGDEIYKNSDTEKFPLAPYVYDDKGDYVKVISNADPEHDYDSQIWIEIPEAWVGKKVKMTMQVQASKEVTAAAAYHSFPGGNHWGPSAGEGVDFTVGEWTPVERILNTKNVLCNKEQQVKYYVLNLSNDAEAITYQFKDIAWSEAPVDTWVDIVPLQDFEAYTGADDEALYVFEKEEPIGSETYRARIVEGKGKDGGNAIEFRTAENAEQGWYSQLSIRFPYALPNGTKVKITADIKATLNTEGLGGQIWNSGFGSYAGGGPSVKFGAVDEWTAYEQETTVNIDKSWDGSDITPKTLRFWVFDGPGGKAANIYYFDNIRVQVPADALPFKDAEGQEIEADPLLGKDYPIFEWIDPMSLDYTEELVTNGDLEDEDMDAFVAKIATEDDADPQILPVEAVDLEKYAVEGKDGDGRNGIAITALKQSENGSADETQLWVRLNEVLPEGTYYVVEFDVMSTNINEIPTWLDINPGTNSSKDGIAKGAAGSVAVKVAAAGEYLHYTNYCVAPEGGVGSIAFNLAGDKNYKYWFDNFSVKIPADAETEEVDEDLWEATLELNVAIDLGKKTETEGYTEESVKALTDAIADGKAELKNAEADAESLADAAADIILAIEGLEEPEEYLPAPDVTGLTEIAQAQEEPSDSGNPLADIEKIEVEGVPVTNYTTKGGICVVFKMLNVDVENADYITLQFAQPTPAGLSLAFWNGIKNIALPEGVDHYDYVFDDPESESEIVDGIIPQVSIISINAGADIKLSVYGVYKHEVAPEPAYTDLTADMYHKWTGIDGSAAIADPDDANCDYVLGSETGCAYGNSNINISTSTQYADLGEWDYLTIVVASDNPRLFFNQNDVADQGGNILVPVTDANYVVSNENGVIVYDLAKFKADNGFVHLNAIKASAYNTQVNITEMKLATGEPYKPVVTAIEGVETAEDAVKDGKYFINGQIVIVKNGVKYNAAGVAIQ